MNCSMIGQSSGTAARMLNWVISCGSDAIQCLKFSSEVVTTKQYSKKRNCKQCERFKNGMMAHNETTGERGTCFARFVEHYLLRMVCSDDTSSQEV